MVKQKLECIATHWFAVRNRGCCGASHRFIVTLLTSLESHKLDTTDLFAGQAHLVPMRSHECQGFDVLSLRKCPWDDGHIVVLTSRNAGLLCKSSNLELLPKWNVAYIYPTDVVPLLSVKVNYPNLSTEFFTKLPNLICFYCLDLDKTMVSTSHSPLRRRCSAQRGTSASPCRLALSNAECGKLDGVEVSDY